MTLATGKGLAGHSLLRTGQTGCYDLDSKGALGVGVKRARNFHVWPVRDAIIG